MDTDVARRDFRTVATALGADPDLAQARAKQLDGTGEGVAEAYLAVLRELCEGRV